MNDIVKQSEFKAVSFIENEKKPDTLSVRLVLQLLRNALSESKPITLNDILTLHAMHNFKKEHYSSWDTFVYRDENNQIKSRRPKTLEEYKTCTTKGRALPWFKMHLGNAILKGRLLAIPAIDIEETEK